MQYATPEIKGVYSCFGQDLDSKEKGVGILVHVCLPYPKLRSFIFKTRHGRNRHQSVCVIIFTVLKDKVLTKVKMAGLDTKSTLSE